MGGKMREAKIEPGTKLYSVSTGRVDPLMKASRDAVMFISKKEGFIGLHPTPDGNYTLWLFDSVNNAIGAKNLMKYRGIEVGNNICEFEMATDNTLEFRGVAAGKDKGKGYVKPD